VFPSQDYLRLSRNYDQVKNHEEVADWNAVFLPSIQDS
jgi:hypothetical protein